MTQAQRLFWIQSWKTFLSNTVYCTADLPVKYLQYFLTALWKQRLFEGFSPDRSTGPYSGKQVQFTQENTGSGEAYSKFYLHLMIKYRNFSHLVEHARHGLQQPSQGNISKQDYRGIGYSYGTLHYGSMAVRPVSLPYRYRTVTITVPVPYRYRMCGPYHIKPWISRYHLHVYTVGKNMK